ncbi:MAG: bifunctional NADP phosphatase/NAD kinase [Methanobrevibacter sp.]|nr:bifunctional NADP phosphatase/NAD kinase [Methanobrevibacter sp.]
MNPEDIDLYRNISLKIIERVGEKIKEHVGNPESGQTVKMGADGTPTAYIDLIAENEVIDELIDKDFYSFLISEEIGELKIGKGSIEYINVFEELKRIYKENNNKDNNRSNIENNNKNNLKNQSKSSDNPRVIFLVDPLDGTNNAVKNISDYGISIAVGEIKNSEKITLEDIELGFIKNYANGQFYQAIKGKGAWLNGKTMTLSNETDLKNTSIGGFLNNRRYDSYNLVRKIRRFRILGSVVLELAYVANGKYDAFLDMRGSRIIDIAASKLIVEESGAIVSDANGNPLKNNLSIHEKTIVVASSNEELHKKIIKTINYNKSNDIKKVGILSRLDKYEAILFGAKLIQILEEKGIDVSIEHSLGEKLEDIKNNRNLKEIIDNISKSNENIANELDGINLNFDYNKYAEDISEFDTDILITLGGDGTLLRGQSKLNNNEIPILGINLGTVGFLTGLDVKDAFKSIESILKGEYYKEKRSQLKVSHGKKVFTALNEVVLMTEKPAKMLNLQVSVDGEIVEEFRADGLIISTPSGSTAYSMSAGGPIVDSKVGAFIIIPICPYKLAVRPLVVSDKSKIVVKLLKKGKKAVLVMDGQFSEEIDDTDEVQFVKSENDVYFIRTSDRYFYKKVKEKLTDTGLDSDKNCL